MKELTLEQTQRLEAFTEELATLCNKHGLVPTYDCGLVPRCQFGDLRPNNRTIRAGAFRPDQELEEDWDLFVFRGKSDRHTTRRASGREGF